MFIATLFLVTKNWKELKCPPIDEWINKLWYIYVMEYHLVVKKHAGRSIEIIMLSDESQIKNYILHDCIHVKFLNIQINLECQKVKQWLLWDGGCGEWEGRGKIQSYLRKLSGMKAMFIIVIIVMVL